MTTVTSKLTVLRRSLALAVAVAATGVAGTSFAATPTAPPSVAVRYNDLNLATPAGVDALYRRIAQAATQVCPDLYSRDLTMVAAAQQCRTEAVARAVRETKNQQLAALHSQRASQG